MDLSGVIFVVLALVWAAYLLPKALRHSDEVARTRSVDEVSERARVVVTPPPSRSRRVRRIRRTRAPLSPGAAAARRRRRILAVLLVACIGTAVAAVVAVVPTWAPAVPGAFVVAFLVLCRVLVRKDRARRAAARRTSAPAAAQPTVPAEPLEQPVRTAAATSVRASAPAEPVLVAPAAASDAPAAAPAAPVGSLDDTGTFREVVVGVPAQRPDQPTAGQTGSLWDPLPVTLPTYVGKPRAMRSVRTISLGEPGVSSSGRDAGDSALVAGARADSGTQSGDAPRVVGG